MNFPDHLFIYLSLFLFFVFKGAIRSAMGFSDFEGSSDVRRACLLCWANIVKTPWLFANLQCLDIQQAGFLNGLPFQYV